MFNPIIETAIGLVFVYLLLSMVCSALQEFIAAIFAWRAKTLQQGIKTMLSGDKDLTKAVYQHPLIKSLAKPTKLDDLPQPSYIPADIFAKTFIDLAGLADQLKKPAAQTDQSATQPNQLPNNVTISSTIQGDTLVLLRTFIRYSPDVNTLLTNIENWYNTSMDRVSGWYRRKARGVILVIAFLVALGSNADTIMLTSAFWHDPTLRAAAVAAATDYVKTHQPQPNEPSPQDKANLFPSTVEPGSAPIPPREETLEQATGNLTETLSQVQAQLTKINVPLGWYCEPCSDAEQQKNGTSSSEGKNSTNDQSASVPRQGEKQSCVGKQNATESKPKCVRGQIPANWSDFFLFKLLGLLLTTLAISQGAPFWFDLLQKLVNLRLAGNPPDGKKSASAKT